MFAGQEIEGKKLGVIGLGAIGVLVANAALHLGMEVYGYDPYMSVDSAWNLSRHIHHVKNLETIYQECDYITLHVPALDDTKGMIDREAAGQMKDGVILLNFARDLLVKEEDLIEALETGHIRKYVTDFPTADWQEEIMSSLFPIWVLPRKSLRTTAPEWLSGRSGSIWKTEIS